MTKYAYSVKGLTTEEKKIVFNKLVKNYNLRYSDVILSFISDWCYLVWYSDCYFNNERNYLYWMLDGTLMNDYKMIPNVNRVNSLGEM